ncbi:CLUMA_CG000951, isoform A [Clunio marinus]|uniref:CLUMA_CG000951, isoform A n=1 Tax=Clunio marinus TaxID=568069 RepID=A0A1J1HL07_9DIPT|nr:CLUMA_CG000951, isoform A [Clunio marinus]
MFQHEGFILDLFMHKRKGKSLKDLRVSGLMITKFEAVVFEWLEIAFFKRKCAYLIKCCTCLLRCTIWNSQQNSE